MAQLVGGEQQVRRQDLHVKVLEGLVGDRVGELWVPIRSRYGLVPGGVVHVKQEAGGKWLIGDGGHDLLMGSVDLWWNQKYSHRARREKLCKRPRHMRARGYAHFVRFPGYLSYKNF